MQTMYPGIVNSPVTELSSAITASVTSITVLNGAALPPAPNLAVIGSGELAETILYTTKSGNTISGITRGLQGTARAWPQGTGIARNFTEYDYAALIANINELNATKATKATTLSGYGITDAAPSSHVGAGGNAHAAATTSANGFMTSAMVTKLNGIATGAQVNRSQATQAQAIAGTDTTTDMSPARTINAIDARTRYGTTAGTATALTLALSPAPASLYTGLQITVKLHTNTGTNPTLNVNSLGAKALYDGDGARFSGESGKIYSFIYDGTNFILRNGGGGAKLNVYTGTTQPTKKEGVWIQTSLPITSIRNDLDIWLANAWSLASYAPMPTQHFYTQAVSDGDHIFVYGGRTVSNTTANATNYRYNTTNNTWTDLTVSVDGHRVMNHCMALVGKKMYVFGGVPTSGGTPNKYVRRYDIATNSWESLPDMPTALQFSTCAVVGTKVYLFGGSTSTSTNGSNIARCYDTVNGTWTNLPNLPEARANASACAIGTKIYIVLGHTTAGTTGGNPNDFCFDTTNNTYTTIATCPTTLRNSSRAIAIGTNIYVFGSSTSSLNNSAFMYDSLTNTWSSLANVPDYHLNHSVGYANGLIYNFSSNVSGSNRTNAYALTSKSYPSGTVVLYRVDPAYGQWQTELVTPAKPLLGVNTRMISHFDDVYIHDGTTLRGNLPSYYGNGTSWVKFKN